MFTYVTTDVITLRHFCTLRHSLCETFLAGPFDAGVEGHRRKLGALRALCAGTRRKLRHICWSRRARPVHRHFKAALPWYDPPHAA